MKLDRMSVVAATVGVLVLAGTGVAAVAMGGSDTEGAPAMAEQPVVLESNPTAPEPTTAPRSNTTDDDVDNIETSDASTGTITWEQAVEIAEQALSGTRDVGSVREVEREYEHGRAVWEVEFTSKHEVYVDAVTGEVVKIEDDDDHYDD